MNSSRKKLIEVALPLEAINAAAAREKSIRHGHPSTLHLWWERRPWAVALQRIAASVWDVSTSSPGSWERCTAAALPAFLLAPQLQSHNSVVPRYAHDDC